MNDTAALATQGDHRSGTAETTASSGYSTLYYFTDRLFRATSADDLYAASLDAILGGLHSSRASILLLDAAGIMRFVAWHRLSDKYRRGVEGHSPWPVDVTEPQPVVIVDVGQAALEEPLLGLVRAEGIEALLFIPLVAEGKLIGKFMAYWDAPRQLSAPDLELAVTIARQLGFCLERMGLDRARRSAEAALRRERELLQSIIDLIPVMITRYEPNKKVLQLNAAFEQTSGWSAADAANISLMKACYPDPEYRRKVEAFMNSCANSWMDILMRTRDGRNLETSWANIRLSDGTQVGIGLDMTERRRGEHAAQQLAAIVESSDDAIVSKDLNGVIVSWNRGAEDLFGYPAAEAVGNPITLIIPEDRRDEEVHILARLRRGERIDHFETTRRRRDGSLVDISLTISPVRDRNGRIVGASKIARDITERRQAEAQRDLLIAELNHRVKNTLATVISIAHLSFAHRRSISEAQQSFDQRIRALAQTHTRLAEANWSGVSLHTVIGDEVAPYRDENGNIAISGPEILLDPKSAISLGMACHELTTNAAKYGALSVPDGRLAIAWQVDQGGNVEITWVESGGPPVKSPRRRGFGRLLLERVLASDLRGQVTLEFTAAGLRCLIAFPLENALPHSFASQPG